MSSEEANDLEHVKVELESVEDVNQGSASLSNPSSSLPSSRALTRDLSPESRGEGHARLFETTIHVILPKNVENAVLFISDDKDLDGSVDLNLESGVKMKQGRHEQHWMTPPIEIANQDVNLRILCSSSQTGILQMFLGRSDHKIVTIKKSLRLLYEEQTFLFPTGKYPKVKLSKAEWMNIFFDHLARSPGSLHQLCASLAGFIDIMEKQNNGNVQGKASGGRSSKEGFVFPKLATKTLGALADLAEEQSANRHVDSKFPKLFVVTVGCYILQKTRDEDLRSMQDVQTIPHMFCAILSCFDAFLSISIEETSRLPSWALRAFTGENRKSIKQLVRESSKISFEWIKQLPGLLVVCNSLDGLCRMLAPPHWKSSNSGIGKFQDRTLCTANFAGREDQYVQVVENMLMNEDMNKVLQTQSQMTRGQSAEVAGLVSLVLSAAPSLSCLLSLLLSEKFQSLDLPEQGLRNGIWQKLHEFSSTGHRNTFRDLLAHWDRRREEYVEQMAQQGPKSGSDEHGVSIGGVASSQQSSVMIRTLNEFLMKETVSVHGASNEDQSAFAKLINDSVIFPGGLLTFLRALDKLQHGRCSWPPIIVTHLFVLMLPRVLASDLNEVDTTYLQSQCCRWLKECLQNPKSAEGKFQVLDELMNKVKELDGSSRVAQTIRQALLEDCLSQAKQHSLVAVLQCTVGIKHKSILMRFGAMLQEWIPKENWQTHTGCVDWMKGRSCIEPIWDLSEGKRRLAESTHAHGLRWEITNAVTDSVQKAMVTSHSVNNPVHIVLKHIEGGGNRYWEVLIKVHEKEAQGNPFNTHVHPCLQNLVDNVHQVLQAARDRKLTFGDARHLIESSRDFCELYKLLVSAGIFGFDQDTPTGTCPALSDLGRVIDETDHKLECIKDFLLGFCRQLEATAVTTEYCGLLDTARKEVDNTFMCDLGSSSTSCWKSLDLLGDVSQQMHPFRRSTVFVNALETVKNMRQEGQGPPLTAQECIKEVQQAFREYSKLHMPFFSGEKVELRHVRSILYANRDCSMKEEFNLAHHHLSQSLETAMYPSDDVINGVEAFQECERDYHTRKSDIGSLVSSLEETWKLDTETDLHAHAQVLKQKRTEDEYPLSSFTNVYREVSSCLRLNCPLSVEFGHFLEFLGMLTGNWAEDLVDFVKEIGDEDVRNWSDSVEDSDSFINEDTVGGFSQVKGFVSSLIKMEGQGASEFLQETKGLMVMHEKLGNPVENRLKLVLLNVYALRALYKRLANGYDAAKKVMKETLLNSRLEFSTSASGKPNEDKLLFLEDMMKKEYSLSDMQDFQSRALLVADALRSGHQAGSRSSSAHPEAQMFIEVVDISVDIVALLKDLSETSHFEYYGWSSFCSAAHEPQSLVEDLACLRARLQNELKVWQGHLENARMRFFPLNFLRARQMRTLWNTTFGHQKCLQSAWEALCMICPGALNYSDFHLPCNIPAQGHADKVIQLGQWLEDVLHGLPQRERKIASTFAHPHMGIERGKTLIGICTSEHIFNSILSVYAASGQYPEPGELLVCDEATDCEDIQLLLSRCALSAGTVKQDSLFCLASVESLTVECQVFLVNLLVDMAPELEHQRCCLAVLSASEECYVIDQLRADAQNCKSLTDEEVGSMLLEHFEGQAPNVVVLTSDFPGMGKTDRLEEIVRNVHGGDCDLVKIPIAGSLHFQEFVTEAKEFLAGHQPDVIHLDISSVDHLRAVDNLLFELLVLKQLETPDSCVVLNMENNVTIAIEIANTLCDDLWNGLHFPKLAPIADGRNQASSSTGRLPAFSRVHLSWDISLLKVDENPLSDIQLVCRHLQAMQNQSFARQDISIDDASQASLGVAECQQLLWTHFLRHVPFPSFAILSTFVKIFSWQLRSLSRSDFFLVDTLKWIGANLQIRQSLLTMLLDLTKNFAIESSSGAYLSQQMHSSLLEVPMEERMVRRSGKILSWDNSNNVMVVFNQGSGHDITPIYKSIAQLSAVIQGLLKSQRSRIPDYTQLSHLELLDCLKQILGTTQCDADYRHGYVLTADNFLKMVLIHLRIKTKVPVVVMGETGCGKTSLINFLAGVSGVGFRTLNIHAGTTRRRIRQFVSELERLSRASNKEIWGFLDEVNTCKELGIINDLVCHQQIDGRPLDPLITILVACNPYKLKDRSLPTAGYELAKRGRKAELVYSVHPLPELMVTFAWDYGQLNQNSERLYLRSMLQGANLMCLTQYKLLEVTVDVLLFSQIFIQTVETPWSTSLRDFRRWILLFNWFRGKLLNTPPIRKGRKLLASCLDILLGRRESTGNGMAVLCSIILALFMTYYMRLGSVDLRESFRVQVSQIFKHHNVSLGPDDLLDILQAEMKSYVQRMELPKGIAENDALLENVFAGIICILNRIPLFLVGKPGCSKSLSMQLIFSNLRGLESQDELFRTYPKVIFTSFQGSESSTSSGILTVFEKAHKFLEPDGKILPVVLLDEIGLAEVSPHNPLKVLHSLLEPGDGKDQPDVAVVGISNWALDAAKMNRAIVLSRPDPGIKDLQKTAKAIHDSIFPASPMIPSLERTLKSVAEYYHEYYSKQPVVNFHGLRDFYSLIKSLCEKAKQGRISRHDYQVAFTRSFGGLEPRNMSNVIQGFLASIGCIPEGGISVEELVQDSINDRTSRHLMLITKGDLQLDILESLILKNRTPVILCGSAFSEDNTDQYCYRMLSQIKIHLREGRLLVLKDLDRIYGALYDMLNQNYTVAGGKTHCRIALGAHNNPMCEVHKDFRCIVIMNQEQLGCVDPPFLNRFEKQFLDLDLVLNGVMRQAVDYLQSWIDLISSQQARNSQDCAMEFGPSDMFAGLNDTSLVSLVLRCHREIEKSGESVEPQHLIEACRMQLMQLAYLDGVVRAKWSHLAAQDSHNVSQWCNGYYLVRHTSLIGMLNAELGLSDMEVDNAAPKSIGLSVMTEMPIHPDTLISLQKVISTRSHRLQTLTSEKAISDIVENFFVDDSPFPRLLLFEASDRQDRCAIQCLHFLCHQHQTTHLSASTGRHGANRHVCIVININRFKGGHTLTKPSQLNFLSNWNQILVSNPQGEKAPAESMMHDTPLGILTSPTMPLVDVFERILFRSYLLLKYPEGFDALGHINAMTASIKGDRDVMECFCRNVTQALMDIDAEESWQKQLACSRVRMSKSGGVLKAAEFFIEEKVRDLVAKQLYVLERSSQLISYFNMNQSMQMIWRDAFLDHTIVSTSNIPDPLGLEYFEVGEQAKYHLPFVERIISTIESQKNGLWSGGDGYARPEICDKLLERLSTSMYSGLWEVFMENSELYAHDFMTRMAKLEAAGHEDTFREVLAYMLKQFKTSLKACGGGYQEDNLLIHLMWWDKGKEISALAKLVSLSSTFGDNLGDVHAGGSLTTDSIIHFALQRMGLCMTEIKTRDDAQKWRSQWESVSQHLHTLSVHMNDRQVSMLANLKVVAEFVAAILGTAAEDVELLKIINQLAILRQGHVEIDYRSAEGIEYPVLLMSNLLGQELEPDLVDALHRSMSKFLLSCVHNRRAADSDWQVCDTICRYFLRETIPPYSLAVLVAIIKPLGNQRGDEFPVAFDLFQYLDTRDIKPMKGNLAAVFSQINRFDHSSQAVAIFADAIQASVFHSLIDWLAAGNFPGDVDKVFQKVFDVLADPDSFSPAQVAVSTALLRCILDFVPTLMKQVIGVGDASSDLDSRIHIRGSEEDLNKALSWGVKTQPVVLVNVLGILSENFRQSKIPSLMEAQMYLLKVLRQTGMSFRELRQLSKSMCKVKICLGDIKWRLTDGNAKLKINSLVVIPGFESAVKKICDLERIQPNNFFQNANAGDRKAIIAAVISILYLPRSWRSLDDGEEALSRWICGEAACDKWPRSDRMLLTKFAANDFPPGRLLLDPKMDAEHIQRVVTEVNLIVALVAGEEVSLTSLWWRLPPGVADSFLPTMPSSSFAEVRQAFAEVHENTTIYTCTQCNYNYVVGNCGSPAEHGICPECKHGIGAGSSGKRLPNSEEIIKGYVPDLGKQNVNFSERSLTPFGHRLLRFWMHTIMRWGSELGVSTSDGLRLCGLTQSQLAQLQDEDWVILRGMHNNVFRGERAIILLNALIHHFAFDSNPTLRSTKYVTTPEERQQWEALYMQDVVSGRLNHVHEVISLYQRQLGVAESDSVEAKIDEIDEKTSTRYLPRLFRSRRPVTVKTFCQSFESRAANADQHPLLAYILQYIGHQHQGDLFLVHHLVPILKWIKLAHATFSHHIMRKYANTTTIATVLESKPTLAGEYDEFEQAWNRVRHVTTQFECSDIGEIPELTRSSMLAVTLFEKRDQGVFLAAIIGYLANVQNTFLEACTLIVNDYQLLYQIDHNPRSGASCDFLRPEHVLDMDVAAFQKFIQTSGFVSRRLEYGGGLEITADLPAIEGFVLDMCFAGKRHIDVEAFEAVIYQREFFQHFATMTADVSAQCSQEALKQDQMDALEKLIVGQSKYSLLEILGSVEVVMCVMKSRSCIPNFLIGKFVSAWIDDESSIEIFCGESSFFGDMLAKHIVALYELVEQMLGTASLDELPNKYCTPLTKDLQADVSDIIAPKNAQPSASSATQTLIRPQAFSKVLGQFIFRYLSGGGESPRADVQLSLYICNTRCVSWPKNSLSGSSSNRSTEDVICDMLPEELSVEHCKALFAFLGC